ncbi:MAG: hemolysin III family protein, partial [Corynebacterium sp.]|nr:hemolysin III family protein [Corynebacterium sp.]
IILSGVIYSVGALGYALKWPTISEHWFGFHEVFHAGTIIAAGLHHIAIWMIVLNAA